MSIMVSRKWAGILRSQVKKKVNLIELEEAVGENSEVFYLSEREPSVSGTTCTGLMMHVVFAMV